MTTQTEALKLALEAFGTLMIERGSIYDKAITAIEEALAQPEQEPVAFYRCNGCGHEYQQMHPTSCDCMKGSSFEQVNYYTTPPQRTWVGLADEDDIDWEEGGNLKDLVKAIEAKLKEKNT